MTRRASGELLLAWSGAREAHVCPFDASIDAVLNERLDLTWPETLMDSSSTTGTRA
jgi:hypothetical protein